MTETPPPPPPVYHAVARRLSPQDFTERDRANASDVVDDGKGNRLRILALTFPGKVREDNKPPDTEIIVDPDAVAAIRAGLTARLETVFERQRDPRPVSQAQ